MSSILLEDQLPVVKYEGLNTNKAVTVGGSANIDASGSTGTFNGPTGINSHAGSKNTVVPMWNYIASETGTNDNAFVVTLTDAAGANVALSLGLVIWVKIGRRLVKDSTATLSFNGVSRSVFSQSGGQATGVPQVAGSQKIHTSLLTGAVVGFVYAGTGWQVIGY